MKLTRYVVQDDTVALLGVPNQFNSKSAIGSIGFNAGRLYGKI